MENTMPVSDVRNLLTYLDTVLGLDGRLLAMSEQKYPELKAEETEAEDEQPRSG